MDGRDEVRFLRHVKLPARRYSRIANMKLNAGIVSTNFSATREFYTSVLGFDIAFENDFYLLLKCPGDGSHLSFLAADHDSQHAVFRHAYPGHGTYLTIEVENLDSWYQRVSTNGIKLAFEPRREFWGDYHFAILDPNGLAIDIVEYSAPVPEA